MEFMSIDFVTAWKTISIALTGVFGIVGLLTRFRNNQSHRITKWGWFSLLGIIVSAGCGVAAQMKESADDSAKALALARSTDSTLKDLEKLVTSLDDPEASMSFWLPCSDHEYVDFCRFVHSHDDPSLYWFELPQKTEAIVSFSLRIFHDASDAHAFVANIDSPSGEDQLGDFFVELSASNERKDGELGISPDPDGQNVFLETGFVPIDRKFVVSNGRLTSLSDVAGSTVVVDANSDYLKQEKLTLAHFTILVKNGQQLTAKGPIQQTRTKVHTIYQFAFPSLAGAIDSRWPKYPDSIHGEH
jgi:hypothetical protein